MPPVVLVPAAGDPPPEAAIEAAADALGSGGCVVLPTDTVYGIAASLDSPEAVRRLFGMKRRPEAVPIAVLVADEAQASALAVLTASARELAERAWPGPLTLVLEARTGVDELVGSGDGSVGVRCPDHPLVRAVAARAGPLATTSREPPRPGDSGGCRGRGATLR